MHQNLHILIAVTSWCTNIPVPIYAPCIHQIITHLYGSTGHHQLSFCDPNKVSPFFPKNLPSDNPFWLASSAPVTISLCFICVTRQPRHPVMPKPGNEFSGIHYSGLVFRKKTHAVLISSVYCCLLLSLTKIYLYIMCHTWLF